MVKVKLNEAGTQLHLILSPATEGPTLTLNMYTANSIDARIWKMGAPAQKPNERVMVGQSFIDVDDLLRAADLIRDMRKTPSNREIL